MNYATLSESMKKTKLPIEIGIPKSLTQWLQLFFLIFIAFVIATFVTFWQLTHPATIDSGLIPTDINRDYEEITLTTIEGVDLHGWYLPPVVSGNSDELNDLSNIKALVFLHGYPAEKSNLLPFAMEFEEYGIVLFDFRSFGKSEGSRTSFGAREILDLEVAIDYLQGMGYERIGVFGFSMGGGVALRAAALDTRIKAVATYAAPANIVELGQHHYRFLGPFSKPFVKVLLLWAQMTYGVDEWELIPEYSVPGIRVPVLLTHSENDTLIPISQAERLQTVFAEYPNELQARWYQNGSHQVIPLTLSTDLFNFFEESL